MIERVVICPARYAVCCDAPECSATVGHCSTVEDARSAALEAGWVGASPKVYCPDHKPLAAAVRGMRALSLTQPWATLVAIGAKQWETRGWPMRYRGELAIHASKGFPRGCVDLCRDEPFRSTLVSAGLATLDDLPRGAIVALVDVVDCLQITEANAPSGNEYLFGNYESGRFMIQLGNVRRLSVPIAAKGSLGLWMVPPDIEARVRDQLT